MSNANFNRTFVLRAVPSASPVAHFGRTQKQFLEQSAIKGLKHLGHDQRNERQVIHVSGSVKHDQLDSSHIWWIVKCPAKLIRRQRSAPRIIWKRTFKSLNKIVVTQFGSKIGSKCLWNSKDHVRIDLCQRSFSSRQQTRLQLCYTVATALYCLLLVSINYNRSQQLNKSKIRELLKTKETDAVFLCIKCKCVCVCVEDTLLNPNIGQNFHTHTFLYFCHCKDFHKHDEIPSPWS